MDTEKPKYKSRLLALTFITLCSFFISNNIADAATIRINSAQSSVSVGDTVTFNVLVNSEGVAINSSDAVIRFPADLFEVTSVTRNNSILSLWVENPAFSNSAGTISFDGGLPTPGFNGTQGSVITFTARAKKAGQAEFSFANASVRANDGFGTDVLNSRQGRTVSVVDKAPVLTEETPVPQVQTTNLTLQVTSETHPSQESWYSDNNPVFKWKVPAGADAIQTGIDNNDSGSPRVTFSPAISERTTKNLEEGTWYFKVRARKDGRFGPITTYIARVDKTSPKINSVKFDYDEKTRALNITADVVDEVSGLDYFEIYVNDTLAKSISPTDFVNGKYSLAVDVPGNNTVKVLAVDRAGNVAESLGKFFVTERTSVQSENVSLDGFKEQNIFTRAYLSLIGLSPQIYMSIIIALMSIILLLVVVYSGRHYIKLRHRLKVRAALTRGDNTRVLLLVKRRLERHLEILQNIRHGRILTDEEKAIKEAIEIDLDEVDRAIEDIVKE